MSESKSRVPAYDELVPKKEAASAASNKAALCKICKKTVHAKDGNKLLFEKITKEKKRKKGHRVQGGQQLPMQTVGENY